MSRDLKNKTVWITGGKRMGQKTKNKLNKKSNAWEYFDDCLVCQAMEKAEKRGRDLSGTELKDAFRMANERQNKKGN